ncbi:MAG: hypothetical protein UX99_C0020G0006 [Candidatus Amesbacteria bacterium GW2011_GWB1_47_26]|uniref:DUF5667 domain-containing protein n=1 Tax=Candidatus Amesbacteria bacterium GW2011_GWC2_45_19 TaxID=1618366 RepID=A0A0G1M3M2_9BACT|nr:MAG: hypothetical protein UX05_C0006G0034 [Candidatus Amesbacteria bacterium GW2011_GWC2_45_19]KKU37235.1 MAG: hypothetical protein UX52_C0032G0006 [Candidatus Amesbacteria bacterium GW2011_GWA1_46_35]KKU68252.1 MAG: hypothetical protein UX93_C0009G0026 [Microgenomates group bacterium GW2011_GWC1_47_20]KKU74237.1 MAG: hypothetical protein UX99_C0020G0006 [Candidatus Amesbacteria bacterium GW2011_GWB1_47_26]KKU79056.1 MAG: hypothetical protein UY06_C0032G0013 [Candidatus Amesbacteria bacteriu
MGTGTQNLPETEVFWKSAWGNLRNALIGCSAALLFGLAVLMMSVLSVSSPRAAVDPVTVKVEYYLPYPGMLPDSPLYKVKALRDRLQLWVTFDEAGKARKELLYADKRIGAAAALVEGGKVSLGVSTATKAEKYLESAVNRTIKLSGEGRDVKSLLLTLTKAVAKHQEVLEIISAKSGGVEKEALQRTLAGVKSLQENLAQTVLEAK